MAIGSLWSNNRAMESIQCVDLESPRTRLVELRNSDLDLLYQLANDPDITRYVQWSLRRREALQAFITAMNNQRLATPRTAYPLAVLDRKTGSAMGFVKFFIASAENEQAELGGYLLKMHWGQGFAKEIAKTVLDFGFRQLKLRRIFAYCDPRNTASIKAMEKLGFTREGLLRSNLRLSDGWRDSYVYGLISSDWDRCS